MRKKLKSLWISPDAKFSASVSPYLLSSFAICFTWVFLLWCTSWCFSAFLWSFVAQKHTVSLSSLLTWDPPSKAPLMGQPFCLILCLWCGSAGANQSVPAWPSPPSWAQRWALRVSDWLPGRHFIVVSWLVQDGWAFATPIPKWIPSSARGWKESDLVINSSGNSPWLQFKAA